MNRDHVEQVLAEFAALEGGGVEPELEAVKAALMLEDVFDIRLSDDEIAAIPISDPMWIKMLLDRRQSGR